MPPLYEFDVGFPHCLNESIYSTGLPLEGTLVFYNLALTSPMSFSFSFFWPLGGDCLEIAVASSLISTVPLLSPSPKKMTSTVRSSLWYLVRIAVCFRAVREHACSVWNTG